MKCHSKRLDSRGAACKVGSGWVESSVASLRMRLMVGDLVLKVGRGMCRWFQRGIFNTCANWIVYKNIWWHVTVVVLVLRSPEYST